MSFARTSASSWSRIRCSRPRACRSAPLSSTSAAWLRRAIRGRSLPIPRTSERRIISPAVSDEGRALRNAQAGGRCERGGAMREHIVRSYEEDLALLDKRVAQMGGLAENLLGQAFEALERRDPQLADTGRPGR